MARLYVDGLPCHGIYHRPGNKLAVCSSSGGKTGIKFSLVALVISRYLFMRHKYDPQDLPAMVPVHHRRMWNSLDAGIYCIPSGSPESQDHPGNQTFCLAIWATTSE